MKIKFARKILKLERRNGDGGTYVEWQLERDLLRIFAREQHDHIVQIISVYQWQDSINFIFPFYPHNLYDVLHASGVTYPSSNEPGVRHWLWDQMVGVADGLETIHSLRNLRTGSQDALFVGFHYDLKPANILVTVGNILKITDFGQAWIKEIKQNDESYGNYRGGSLIYRPPEACPTRKEIEQVNKEQKDSDRRSAGKGKDHEALPRIHNVYDVWSLGCIMLEVLEFIWHGGSSAVDRFQRDREEENSGITFHNGQGGARAERKQAVTAVIDLFSSQEQGSAPNVASTLYLRGLSILLKDMLCVDSNVRHTSSKVVSDLLRLRKEFDDNDTPEDGLVKYLKHRPLGGYDETPTSERRSFIHMSVIPGM